MPTILPNSGSMRVMATMGAVGSMGVLGTMAGSGINSGCGGQTGQVLGEIRPDGKFVPLGVIVGGLATTWAYGVSRVSGSGVSGSGVSGSGASGSWVSGVSGESLRPEGSRSGNV
jgi:hypothetical protein